jgi:hypothetical protein
MTVRRVDVPSGRMTLVRRLDPSLHPGVKATPGLRLSLNPEGTKLLTTVRREHTDIWILDR